MGDSTVGDFAFDVNAYLKRIGLDAAPSIDLAGLTLLQRAHLATVPFENLDVVADVPVRTELAWSIPKVVDQRRGGWCFELNGAFGALLRTLGFEVKQLGAAVLLDGPNTMIDHLALEVSLDRTYLVDVGFGEGFISPLDLNLAGAQIDPAGTFEFINSSQGMTLTWHDDSGVPVPQYRFKRVHHELAEFEEASMKLSTDPWLLWSTKPFATRLLDANVDGTARRVTLLSDRTKIHGDDAITEERVAKADWNDVLFELFAMESPL